jgi:hypothetical protein
MVEPVTLAVEGPTDAVVLRRLIHDAGLAIGAQYIKIGKAALDQNLSGFNQAAQFSTWLILRDLNDDEECAPALREKLLPVPARRMRFHIAVRAMEAWLLADAEAMATFLGITVNRVPFNPEGVRHPKVEIVNLARHSRRRRIREAIIPAPGSTASVGPGYSALISEFAAQNWRPHVAENRSPSLSRLIKYLEDLRQRSE